MTGLPFLTTTVANMRLAVEIAFGADLTDLTGGSWTWTDVTADVILDDQQGQPISITIGKADESQATQTSQFTCTLDNRTGKYSQGGQSPFWPNVKRNTPVRCRVSTDNGSTWDIRYQGGANGFTPVWDDQTGRWATVTLSGSGPIRRLDQGTRAPISVLRRYIMSGADSTVTQYWPCEDLPGTITLSQAIGTSGSMFLFNLVNAFVINPAPVGAIAVGSDSTFSCSDPLPALAGQSGAETNAATGCSIVIPLPPSTTKQVSGLFIGGPTDSVPFFGFTDTGDVYQIFGTGGSNCVFLQYLSDAPGAGSPAGGIINLAIRKPNNVFVASKTIGSALAGVPLRWRLAWSVSGGTTTFTFGYIRVGDTTETITTLVVSSFSFSPTSPYVHCLFGGFVDASNSPYNGGGVVGHLTYHNAPVSLTTYAPFVNAHSTETPAARISRLCAENTIQCTILDSAVASSPSISDAMGPQRVDTLSNLIREAETTGQGALYDGLGIGLTYATRAYRESVQPSLTLDASTGQIKAPFSPVDDDQNTINQAFVTLSQGPTVSYEDDTGPLGVDAVGVFSDSLTVNSSTSTGLVAYAQWLVSLGTLDGYRYPNVSFELETAPSLIASWLAMTPSQRIDVINIPALRAQHPAYSVRCMLEGYQEFIGQFTWSVTANCSSYEPWRVATLAAATGSTADTVCHLDTDSSQLNTSASLGATSISVKTNSGPLWVTTAADADSFPFDIDLGGVKVTVSAITGATSPQTFTVSALPQAFTAGAGCPISVWRPAVAGL